ncbi:MAG: ABC transporter substrate-binding protein, partial [Candidatus Dadabacteria bacterium]
MQLEPRKIPAVLAAVAAAALLFASQAPAAGEAGAVRPRTPEAFVAKIADDVLAVLRNSTLDREQKKMRLERELDTCCDFETTSKLVLARNWKKFSPEQREEFVALFKRYLIATYQGNIDAYGGETVEIAGGREEPRGDYTVMTKIKRPGAEDILVDYRLRRLEDGSWRIIDVIAEGISLVSNLRSQFQEVISRSGPEG